MFPLLLFISLLFQGQKPTPPPPPAPGQAQAPSQPTAPQPGNGQGQTGQGIGAGPAVAPAPRPSNTDPFFDPGAVKKRALLVPWESASARAEFAKKQGLGKLGKFLTNEVTLVGIYQHGNELVASFRTPDTFGLSFAKIGTRFFNGRIIEIVKDGDSKDKKVVVEGRLQPNGKIERIEIPLRKDSSQ